MSCRIVITQEENEFREQLVNKDEKLKIYEEQLRKKDIELNRREERVNEMNRNLEKIKTELSTYKKKIKKREICLIKNKESMRIREEKLKTREENMRIREETYISDKNKLLEEKNNKIAYLEMFINTVTEKYERKIKQVETEISNLKKNMSF